MRNKPQAMPVKSIRVLLVEDDASDAYLVTNALDSVCPGEFSVTHCRSLEEALPLLQAQNFDIALLDLSLPGSSDLEAMKGLRHAAPQLPIVILTGFNDEALALSAMKHGVQDFLVKEQVNGQLIKRSLCYAIERKHFEDNLTVLANYDALTGLANRSLFERRLEMALARGRRSREALAVFFIDLDRFKQVNDRFGHEAGDTLLKQVAQRLTAALRECDTIVRFGGDEFAALLEGTIQPRGCALVAQKMIDALSQPFALKRENSLVTVGVSIGIALGMPDVLAGTLMRQADEAMYRAKAIPGSNYQFYTEHMHQEITGRLQLEQELMLAMKNKDGLYLYYQPKWDLASGSMAGAEALIRWDHPSRGLLAPNEFLPLLQPSIAAEMDSWVLETVCRDISCWQAAGLNPIQVSVHISNYQWKHARTIEALLAILKKASLITQNLAIEVEESTLSHHAGDSFNALLQIRDMGIEVHLDNFGRDMSSLKMLTHSPLDAIKIDHSLTSGIDKKRQDTILVHALVELAHQLGIKIIAEGVETVEQEVALSTMRCDQIQGSAISRPLPATDFFNWMCRRAS